MSFLSTNIRIRMKRAGCDDIDAYYEKVIVDSSEWEALVDHVTVHETRFYRHKPSLHGLINKALPYLLAQKKALRILSVGCSTGEEAYTIAIEMLRHKEATKEVYAFSVCGIDVSIPVIVKAVAAKYHGRSFVSTPDDVKAQYFEELGNSTYQVKQAVRDTVTFQVGNAMSPAAKAPNGADIIFCQNMLIYLPTENRLKAISYLVDELRAGGFLFLGNGEDRLLNDTRLKRIGVESATIYQKIETERT